MQKLKRFVWNALCATAAWILYNTFFLFLYFMYVLSMEEWRFNEAQLPFFYDVVAPILLLVLYALAFVGFVFIGKKILAATGLHLLNLVSLALGYAFLWALVGWVFDSEHTSMDMTNFLIVCLADALDSKYLSRLNFDWSANACVMAIPFICMFIGLTVRQVTENKQQKNVLLSEE